jgi:hypothetical protein
VIQRTGDGTLKAGGGRRADESIEDHRDAQHTRMGNRPCHRRQLSSTKAAQDLQRVTDGCRVRLDPRCNRCCLRGQTRVIDAGAAPGPILGRTAIERMGNRCGHCGVADPHFARDQQISVGVHGVPARGQRFAESLRVHGGTLSEVSGGSVERDGHHVEPRARQVGQLVDCSPARLEVRHHLRGDIGRKRADAAGRYAMISGKDRNLRRNDPRPGVPAPGAVPDGKRLQPAQRARGFRQLPVARFGPGAGELMGTRSGAEHADEVRRSAGDGHGHCAQLSIAEAVRMGDV